MIALMDHVYVVGMVAVVAGLALGVPVANAHEGHARAVEEMAAAATAFLVS